MGSTKYGRRSVLRLAASSGVALGVFGLAACQQIPAAAPTTASATATTVSAAPPTTAATATPAPTPPAAAATPASVATSSPEASVTPSAAPRSSARASGIVRWQSRGDELADARFVAETFAKQYPSIRVSVESVPDDRDAKLITAMVGGTAPDVFESWSDNVTQYADRAQVVDVEPLAARDYPPEEVKDFHEWQWRDFVIPTAQGPKIRFGLPKYVNVMTVWYNKDAFDKAGVQYPNDSWTHETYAEAARKLTIWEGNVPKQFGLFYPVWTWDRSWYKLDSWGGSVVDPNDNTKAAFDSERSLAAFEWSRKLMWDDKAMAQRLLLLGTGTRIDSGALFAAGKYAMCEEGFYPRVMAENLKQLRWGYMHVPLGPTGKRKVLGTTDGWVMWKGSKAQDAAWELMRFLAGPDFQLHLVESTGLLPVRRSALAGWRSIVLRAHPDLEQANVDVGPRAMEMGYPGNRQFFRKDAEARQIVVPALERVFVTGNTPVSYLKEVAQQVTQRMRS